MRSADPPQQTASFIVADSSVVWTLENSPTGLRRLHFPNLQGHRHEGASKEPHFVSEGESQSTGVDRGGPPAFDQFASYSFAEVFFSCKWETFKQVCGNTSLQDMP